jgi:hypothetical protein
MLTLTRLAIKIDLAQILATMWTGLPVRVKKDTTMAITPKTEVASPTHRRINAVRIMFSS